MPMRVVEPRRWQVFAAFLILGVGATVGGYYLTRDTHRLARAVKRVTVLEQQTNALRKRSVDAGRLADLRTCRYVLRFVRGLVEPGVKTLGKPGTPGYAYWHAHPGELRKARHENEKLLGGLEPSHCLRLTARPINPPGK